MVLTFGVLLLLVGLCRLYKANREHAWQLALVSVAFGLVVLAISDLGVGAEVLAGHLVQLARTAADRSAPFLLLVVLFSLLWQLARLSWRRYPRCTPTGRGIVLLVTVSLGVAVAALLRVAPFLPDVAHVAGEGARVGWHAGVETALDEAGDRADLSGGGVPP